MLVYACFKRLMAVRRDQLVIVRGRLCVVVCVSVRAGLSVRRCHTQSTEKLYVESLVFYAPHSSFWFDHLNPVLNNINFNNFIILGEECRLRGSWFFYSVNIIGWGELHTLNPGRFTILLRCTGFRSGLMHVVLRVLRRLRMRGSLPPRLHAQRISRLTSPW